MYIVHGYMHGGITHIHSVVIESSTKCCEKLYMIFCYNDNFEAHGGLR